MDTEINSLNHAEISPKKRVLFIVTQSEIGGAQRFLHMLVPRLDKDQRDMIVVAGPNFSIKNPADAKALAGKQVSGIKYDLLDRLEKEEIETIRLKYLSRDINPWSDFQASLELKRIIKKWQPDTLFLCSSKAGFLGSFVAKYLILNTKYRIIYRIGGWSFNDPGPKWKKWIWIFLERLSARWKDIIIVNSKHDLDQSKILKIKPRDGVRLIYNGLDVYKIDFLNREEALLRLFEKAVKQSGKVFNAGVVIGTVANFYPTKGLKYLIEAAEYFKNNDDVVFIVIGDGIEHLQLEQLIAKKGLEKKILLLGQLPNAHQFMPAFDVFVLPSVKEGFPWTVIEAMAAKLPVIATKVGAVPEIIEDNKNGMLVEPAHPEQIVKKIQELIGNEHLRQELGIQAHQTVLFKFSLEKMVKEIEKLLDRLST